jgi:ribosomal protein L1
LVGTDTLINEIKEGKFNFDILLTTPEHIRDLAPVAKQL